MNIVQKLTDLGLYVKRSERGVSYRIFDFRDEGSPEELEEAIRIASAESSVEYIPADCLRLQLLCITKQDDGWDMSRWEYTPGPGPDDFFKTYATEDEVLAAALKYFAGEPTVIDGWLIPLHRYPDLDFDMVQQAIKAATNISDQELKYTVKERWRKLDESGMWRDNPFQLQFLDIPHVTNSEIRLKLRRDSQEAFIINAGSV